MSHPDPGSSLTPGMIRVEGADAASFLRAQLSNDVLRLGSDRHFLAAWCDAKGRTQLVMQVIAIDQAYLLLVPRPLIEAAIKRLRLYVLRLDVQIADASDRYRLSGRLGMENAPAVNETRQHGDGGLALGLPPTVDGTARTLFVDDNGPASGDLALDEPGWQLAGIDAGVPAIGAATQGEFVPQMLNLHWLMGIDFDKGCYPGQEVIARLHYRGRLIRRVFRLAYTGSQPAPGTAVFGPDGNRVGTIVQACGVDSTRGRALAVLHVDHATGTLATEQDTVFEVLALPYATPD